MELVEAINKHGFPIIAVIGIAYIIYYVWNWVTKEIKPVIKETSGTLINLINRIRLLENDLIRLKQKVDTVVEIRGKVKYGKKHE